MDITEICMECKNFFLKDRNSIHAGTYTINSGIIKPIEFLTPGQYFYIHGSIFNDGVYQYTEEPIKLLTDEVFDGSVWAMSVPPAFLQLCSDIDAWRKKFETVDSANMSPFVSETVSGVYSRTKASAGSSDGSSIMTWQSVFRSKLRKWRKISIL